MKVNILMSTYDGERFLAQQLDSILEQSLKDWTLLIRDDGSSDRTPEIIADYARRDPRIVFINPDQRENLGVIKNFYTLLKYQEADFYFFCDQDDVWLPEKLELCLKEGQNYPADKPLLVYTDLKVVNQDLEVQHTSMIRTQSDHANTSLLQELTENTVTGGVAMINGATAQNWQAQNLNQIIMHDWFLALVAAAKGNLVYIDQATELYRQHDNNVLGARTWSKRIKHWIRPHKLLAKYWWLIDASQKQAGLLLDLDLAQEQKELVEAYVGLLNQPWSQRRQTLKQYGFAKNQVFHTLVFKTLILTKIGYGHYQKHGYQA
ncbi:glycosyltransferase family 2 protein [Streptococcus sobrinus]|uniref:Glycosyltransferase, group 2 family protein n=2 Tax=Streptococcus sobrinus TaxID=1310 RepID=U2KHA6_9STRE|nr:glycosyltransferase family 2 protein [Streptococcus sobrinus]AWN19191.1 glycosyltransferase family 2 protein [Streptococcus sobrinus]ERJ74228.1 glycosyltransferase, group 2 family protein [Streptococcus sobrinus W1703]